ncbi:kinase-like domain-containing protein [Jimgerdemannia flammicorona]|uniref:Kinase-like domain-containing protein n=1 Tax=Jimgerdemannia flammicorona TaxID=994334 RepID=A0A433DE35_9FUNG|nr:kinase-like domain-containing protein [Jimgerdemannia flammicorona]
MPMTQLVFSIELSLHVVTARVFGLSQNTRTGQYLMCMEYARGGNLEQYPQHSDWHTVFEIANELAEKLYQMHKVGIIHQDLHAGNVVFFSNPKSKPSDIGIWSDLQQTYLYRQRQALRIIDVGLGKAVENWHDNDGVYGRLAYHPPEIFNMQGYTKASDIYCLGTLLWQIVTTVPPQGVANQMCEGREDGLREDLIPGAPEGYNDIIRMCWEQDPSNRPNISTVSILFTMMRSDSDKTAIPFSRETKAFIKKRRAAHAKEIKKKDSFAFVSNASRFTTREELEQIINSQC